MVRATESIDRGPRVIDDARPLRDLNSSRDNSRDGVSSRRGGRRDLSISPIRSVLTLRFRSRLGSALAVSRVLS